MRSRAEAQEPRPASSSPDVTRLTAETVIGALEDAEDYKAFEAAITADYDAQSAVERELVLRLEPNPRSQNFLLFKLTHGDW